MKTTIILIALIFCINLYAEETVNYPISLGPYVSLKGGVNTIDPPQGIKNGFTMNPLPDFGATVYLPFSKNSLMGGTFDLGLSTLAYKLKIYGNESINWIEKYQYLNLGPNFHIGGFIVGFNFGIPLSATTNDIDIPSDNLALTIDVHLGAMIPLYKDDFGRVNLIFQGGYLLTGVVSKLQGTNIYGKGAGFSDDKYIPVPAWGSIGVSYLFNLTSWEE